MAIRKIVHIDEEKCNGCGLCIPACKEGAIRIIDGKARLVSDVYCDGLGACLGECPQGAITIIEREAEEFDEEAVKKHLEEEAHALGAHESPCGCPGARVMEINRGGEREEGKRDTVEISSELKNWPLQLMLVPPSAPYLQGADVVFMADCTGFAYPNLHRDFIRNRVVIIACPKLDDTNFYLRKLTEMARLNRFRSVEVVMMEVPCCQGLGLILEQAFKAAGQDIYIKKTIIGIGGEVIR